MSKRATVGRKTRVSSGYQVHFTQTYEADAPHLMVEVMTTEATTPDGQVVGDLHDQGAEHELLPKQHLVDRGSVDAEVLAQSQTAYHVDLVGPVPPDLSWQTKAAQGFDQSPFTLDWQAHQVTCPAGRLSQRWNPLRDHQGKPVIRVRFPPSACQACPFHEQCTRSPARVLNLQPNEQAYRARKSARARERTPAFRTVSAKRAGVEGTIAQAVRTCELRRARSIGRKKRRLQAFCTATAMNVLRACEWLETGTHASTPTSRFAKLVRSAQAVAAA